MDKNPKQMFTPNNKKDTVSQDKIAAEAQRSHEKERQEYAEHKREEQKELND